MSIVRSLQSAIAALAVVLLASGAMAQAPQRPPYGRADQSGDGEEDRRRRRRRSEEEQLERGHRHRRQPRTAGVLRDARRHADGQRQRGDRKARTSATYRRASKEFEDGIGGGRNAILGLPGVTPIEGGLTIVVGGKMIGAIGVSGVTSPQDAQIARAGLDALK